MTDLGLPSANSQENTRDSFENEPSNALIAQPEFENITSAKI